LAVRRVLEGRPAAEVARLLEVHERTVRRWVKSYEAQGDEGLAAKPQPGRPPKLDAQQAAQVLAWVSRSPTEAEFGFPTELWTGPRVAELIERRLRVRMNANYLVGWLRDRGVTSQAVRRRPRGHNPVEMARWQREEWPRILKKRPKPRRGSS
jgi:transposase